MKILNIEVTVGYLCTMAVANYIKSKRIYLHTLPEEIRSTTGNIKNALRIYAKSRIDMNDYIVIMKCIFIRSVSRRRQIAIPLWKIVEKNPISSNKSVKVRFISEI